MDPNAAIEMIEDGDAHENDRWAALEGLATWLARGGAVPACGARLIGVEMIEDDTGSSRDTISACNVAMAYGDLSGLVGMGYAR